jgi:hypothetical protein
MYERAETNTSCSVFDFNFNHGNQAGAATNGAGTFGNILGSEGKQPVQLGGQFLYSLRWFPRSTSILLGSHSCAGLDTLLPTHRRPRGMASACLVATVQTAP